MKQTQLRVSGMSCANCARTIASKLQSLPGVQRASVNFASREAWVEYDDTVLHIPHLIEAIQQVGYEASDTAFNSQTDLLSDMEYAHYKILKKQFWLSAILTFPVILWTMMAWVFPNEQVVFGVMATIVLWFGGGSFYQDALKAIWYKTLNMNTLIVLGTGSAYLFSVVAVLNPAWFLKTGLQAHTYFEVVMGLITFLLLGRMMEARAKGKTSEAVERLIRLQPRTANRVQSGETLNVPIEEIGVGDLIHVRPGEKFPTDGIVQQGETTVDESMMTGESVPIHKVVGDPIIGATMNQLGNVVYQVTRIGKESLLQQVIQMVEKAQGSKAPIQRIADTVSGYFVMAILGIAVLTFCGWMIFGPNPKEGFALTCFVSVLVVACPCALGLATPTALMVGMGKAAENGILIKNAETLERTHQVNCVVFDKTGTLTQGQMAVVDIISKSAEYTSNSLLQLAASVEYFSEHGLGKAIVQYAHQNNMVLLPVSELQVFPGRGVKAKVEGHEILLGNLSLIQQEGFWTASMSTEIETLAEYGQTLILVGIDHQWVGNICIADSMKENAALVIRQLKERGIEVWMLTGDHLNTAKAVASSVGISQGHVIAGVLPTDKVKHIQQLQSQDKVVAMVGDGINDAPALAQADVGIALGTGSDIAIESAGIILRSNNLASVVQAITLSHNVMRIIKQNLFFAFFYNSVGIPIAAGLLYPLWGIILNPMIAGAAMAFSSVSVVANSLRLRHSKGY